MSYVFKEDWDLEFEGLGPVMRTSSRSFQYQEDKTLEVKSHIVEPFGKIVCWKIWSCGCGKHTYKSRHTKTDKNSGDSGRRYGG